MAGKKVLLIAVLICCLIPWVSHALAAGNKVLDTEQKTENRTAAAPQRDSYGNTVFENSGYLMTLDEKNLGITLKDKKSGYQYESVILNDTSNASWKGFMNSGVSVEFYSAKSTMPERVDLVKGAPKITFNYFTDGFTALLNYESYQFQMQVEVVLTEDGFTAAVDQDSIIEGDTYKLGAIYLYPMFGATKLGEKQGYMFVPEGAGALIDLVDNHAKFNTPYTKKIYGNNIGIDKTLVSSYNRPSVTEPEKITMPVFGMILTQEQQGFLGIAEDGMYNADILAYPNGVTTDYNWITAKFDYREVYTMQTSASSGVPTYEKNPYLRDIKVRYKMVSGENANYAGLAKVYQKYLLASGALEKHEDNYRMKLDFFGADTKKWFIFNVVVPMTRVSQMGNIIDDLAKNNVKDILPVYSGWQSKGASLNYGSGKFKLEGKLGSQKELLSLVDKLKEQNVSLVLKQDLLLANPNRFYNTSKDIVKGINQVIVERPTNASVFGSMYFLTPQKSLSLAKNFMNQYSGKADQVALTSITNTLFSYYSGGNIYTRGDTAEKQQEIMDSFHEFELSAEAPNAYLWKYTAQYFEMPMTTSNYAYLSKEVPFLPIVLKGYIPYWANDNNFEANESVFFLKMIEYGAYPSFLVTEKSPSQLRDTNSSYIYTSQYTVLKDTIISYYDAIGEALRKVEGVPIKSHEYLTNDVVSVVYENGVQFVINYSDDQYVKGDITVPAMSFSVY